ncbi:TetR/AcrR family transcriptional regulator [Kutzneria chonburiensis]|uniref:TetR/AcrR family transcriptional regulator n=1 Tax=Kutzneria chonburiensis TaxID=1483604 RepID=A0ABV6MUR8_9PSEU|nr:TetR/AcrR family transcriptional regulator [Kutzneria chonburiensis]
MSAPVRRRGPSKGDLKQEALLETAERLLATRPLAEIGIEELARGAGISRSSFYFYFESRQAMLLALLSRVSDELVTQVVECWLQPQADMRHTVRQSIELAVRMWDEHGAVLLAAQNPDAPAEAQEFMADLNGRLVAASEEMIERNRATGAAPAGPPSAHSMATMLVGMTEHTISHNVGALGQAELVDTLTAIWHRAIFAAD